MDLTTYIPQIITAVATLGGVVLTLILTGRREAKRFDKQMEFERVKLLNGALREACAAFLKEANAFRMRSFDIQYADPEVTDISPLQKLQAASLDSLALLKVDVELLVPQLGHEIMQLQMRLISLKGAQDEGTADRWGDYIDPVDTLITRLTDAMNRAITVNNLTGIDFAVMMADGEEGAHTPHPPPSAT